MFQKLKDPLGVLNLKGPQKKRSRNYAKTGEITCFSVTKKEFIYDGGMYFRDKRLVTYV